MDQPTTSLFAVALRWATTPADDLPTLMDTQMTDLLPAVGHQLTTPEFPTIDPDEATHARKIAFPTVDPDVPLARRTPSTSSSEPTVRQWQPPMTHEEMGHLLSALRRWDPTEGTSDEP